MLDARESLFLRRRNDLTINDQAGGGVVIKSGDAKNAYQASTSGLEQGIDEGGYGRTLCQHQQSANQHERYHYWRQPILLVFSHELPELINNLRF
jgi:hypothetical protein